MVELLNNARSSGKFLSCAYASACFSAEVVVLPYSSRAQRSKFGRELSSCDPLLTNSSVFQCAALYPSSTSLGASAISVPSSASPSLCHLSHHSPFEARAPDPMDRSAVDVKAATCHHCLKFGYLASVCRAAVPHPVVIKFGCT